MRRSGGQTEKAAFKLKKRRSAALVLAVLLAAQTPLSAASSDSAHVVVSAPADERFHRESR